MRESQAFRFRSSFLPSLPSLVLRRCTPTPSQPLGRDPPLRQRPPPRSSDDQEGAPSTSSPSRPRPARRHQSRRSGEWGFSLFRSRKVHALVVPLPSLPHSPETDILASCRPVEERIPNRESALVPPPSVFFSWHGVALSGGRESRRSSSQYLRPLSLRRSPVFFRLLTRALSRQRAACADVGRIGFQSVQSAWAEEN